MNRLSILQQSYLNQTRFVIEQPVTKNNCWQGKYRFFFIWMLIGVLVGGIPLSAIITMYTKQTYIPTVKKPALNPLLRWNTAGITVAGISNMAGNANNQLNGPHDVMVDYVDTIYVADSRNNRIQKYVRGASSGITIAGQANTTSGSSPSHLKYPVRVLCNENGDCFIADTNNNRIQFWSNGASSGTTVFGDATGIGGTLNNQLFYPYGITRDSTSATLYIADSSNNRVMSYVSGTSSGIVIAGNGGGLNSAPLSVPYGHSFDAASNSLIISNFNQHNIVQLMLATNNWTILAGDSNGSSGSTSTRLNSPTDVTLDPMGNIYVADTGNCRIQLFMRGQTDGITIAGITGQPGSNSALLTAPVSVKLDTQLNLYVADIDSHRIQKFLRY